jgi:peptide/nickel transport system substrate-binding protein
MDSSNIDRRSFLRRSGALAGVGATGGLGTLLSACGSGGGATQGSTAKSLKPVRGGAAVLATVDKPVNLDPADGQLYSSMQVYQNVFSSLIDVDPNFRFVPGLASSWKQEDEKTWLLELVDNAYFHNGEPFTSADVAYTIQRLKKHALGTFTAAFDRVEKLGKHRARIHLSQPYGPVEASLAGIIEITNKKAVEGSNPKLKPVGTGPYRMTEWVQDDHVTLERFDKYFKSDKPYFDTITFKAIGDDGQRLTGLQTGELDWIQRVPPQRVDEFAKSSEIVSSLGRPYNPDMVILNCTKPPFNDVRVRQAVAWAVDRDEIINVVWFKTATAATEAVSKPNPWYSGVNPYEGGPDLDKAKSLLREAGAENLQLKFIAQPQVATQLRTGQVLQSQLAKIGIKVKIESFEPAQYFEQLVTHKFDLTTSYFSATMDPAHLYYPLLSTGSPWNFPGYSNKQTDALLAKFNFEADQDVRKQVYPELVRRVAEEAPLIFVANEIQRYWTRPNVHGSAPVPSLEIRAEDLWRES